MTEFQRIQWLLSSPSCAEMNHAMQVLTGVDYHTNEQHKESGKTRQQRDDNDAFKILQHVVDRNSFDGNDHLRSIETGMTAEEKVNVDRCKDIGTEIINALPGQPIFEYTFKSSKQAVTLSSRTSIKVNDDQIHVDLQLLFQRLTTVARMQYPDISVLFSYELSSQPSSLFDVSGLPRQAQKSTLATCIWSLGDCSSSEIPRETEYVLDGGSLIHKLPWEQKASFGHIVNGYVNYVLRKFGQATVVFDGYPDGPSTKDIAHHRRSKGIVGRKDAFWHITTFSSKKEHFLANIENKTHFIRLLGECLHQKGCTVIYAREDADTLIARTAIDKSAVASVAVVGEDTDLLVLLLNYIDPECTNNVLFFSDRHARDCKVWDIRKASKLLSPQMCEHLPLIHAITGCDTTSRVFGIGKGQAMKQFLSTPSLHAHASVFLNSPDTSSITKDSIIDSGEEIISHLFSGMQNETLDQLRYRKFVTKTVSCNSFIQVTNFPQHVLRTISTVSVHSIKFNSGLGMI